MFPISRRLSPLEKFPASCCLRPPLLLSSRRRTGWSPIGFRGPGISGSKRCNGLEALPHPYPRHLRAAQLPRAPSPPNRRRAKPTNTNPPPRPSDHLPGSSLPPPPSRALPRPGPPSSRVPRLIAVPCSPVPPPSRPLSPPRLPTPSTSSTTVPPRPRDSTSSTRPVTLTCRRLSAMAFPRPVETPRSPRSVSPSLFPALTESLDPILRRSTGLRPARSSAVRSELLASTSTPWPRPWARPIGRRSMSSRRP
jgi:hypothetical protein